MTVTEKVQQNMPEVDDPHGKPLKVKLKAGASIIKVKPIFSHDSKFLIVASHCNLKVFTIASGDCFQTLKGHRSPIVSIQENKRNQLQILSCSEDGIVIRWDYMSGTAVKTYNLKLRTSVSAFYSPLTERHWFVSTKIEDTESHRLYSMVMVSNRVAKKFVVLKPVLPDPKTVAFGAEAKFVTAVYRNMLHLYDCIRKTFKSHKTGDRELTCVACHPSEYLVATGDNTGRVLVWANMLTSNHPTRSIYHWHTLPVADLAFSAEGSHIYSGGGESALVKWNLNSENKRILPRLGLPICFVAASRDNSLVATSHTDNAVQIISAQNQVVQVIQGLTLGHFHGVDGNNVAPTGLQYDPRTSSIVINGRPGHLQFYKVHEDKQLFNLDIVGRNIMSQERNSVVINPDVDKAALSRRGTWLATVESRDDRETSPEIHLKFWNFELTSQKFTLNTSVFLPHYKKINCIKFRPPCQNPKDPYPPMAVTTSNDKLFKLWVLNCVKNGDKNVSSWSCESMGYYRDLHAGDACFSEDGSLLAVAFGHVVTLWTPDTTMLKATLFQAQGQSDIQQLIFGRNKCNHLLVCHSGSLLTVWDVLTLTVKWTVKCDIHCLAGDSNSDVMAAFTKDKNMFVFRPNSPKPLAFLRNVSDTSVVSAIFVPRQHPVPVDEQTTQDDWLQNSEIYFLNENQELITVCDDCDEEQGEGGGLSSKIEQNTAVTPFALLQAQHQRTATKLVTDVNNKVDEGTSALPFTFSQPQRQRSATSLTTNESVETDDEDNEAMFDKHNNPTLLCQMLIPSLLFQNKRNLREQYVRDHSHIIKKNDSDSDEELYIPHRGKRAIHKDDVLPSEMLNMEIEECHSNESVIEDFGFLRKFLST